MDLNKNLNIRYPYWYVRRDIFNVILIGIESIFTEDFNSLDEIKKIVIQECEKANISERKQYSDISKELRINTCNEEKQKFYDYINNIDEKSLKEVDRLFYRRVISEEKINEIKKRINEKWNNIDPKSKDIICFNKDNFRKEISINDLLDIIGREKIERIYEINNGGIDSSSYLMDLSALDFYFTDGFNIYWCSDEMSWMFEENHEDFYLIYGECLIKEIKRIWLIKLGMSRDEVYKILGCPKNPEEICEWVGDYHISYKDNKVNFIEIPNSFMDTHFVLFNEVDVFRTEAKLLVRYIFDYGKYDEDDWELGYSYKFPTLGMGFWRPTIFEYEMVNNPEFKEMDEEVQRDEIKYLYFESVCVYTNDYYKKEE